MPLLQAACLAAPAFANSKDAWCHWRDWATGGEVCGLSICQDQKARSLAAVWFVTRMIQGIETNFQAVSMQEREFRSYSYGSYGIGVAKGSE